MDLKLKPVFLGGIMQATGNQPPATNATKASYLVTDMKHLSQYFNLSYNQPKDFWNVIVTKGTLKTQRFITAVDMTRPEFTEQLSRELWNRIYVEDLDATEPESLRQAALKAGMNENLISDALNRMTQKDVKDRLIAYTKEALDLGAFGAPYIVAHVNGKKEIFFGSDRFPVMALIIGEKWQGPDPGVKSHL
ncbi:hypothetical protein C0Q70_03895 [Pomacea canaliculata]|uniref:Glutathione S-transferase kappa n=2 Tax=Pomacea canaliculata TaxID=400727 RepID=A0A2T7PU04_POMCA|nr:hypothetical protein C0Q70_03895 [Pomacea canaliculata]